MKPRATLARRIGLGSLFGLGAVLALGGELAANPSPIDLATALQLAGANNLDVQIAKEKVAEANAANDAARARFFPWIVPSLVVRRHEDNLQAVNGPVLDADKQSLAAGLALNGQVDLGETYYQNLVAKQAVKSSQAALAGRQREVTFRVAVGYFDLARARAAVIASEEGARIAGQHVKQIAATASAGLTFAGDAARVRVAHERAELTLARARTAQRIAAARLAELLRLDPAIELVPADADLAPLALTDEPADLGTLISQALARRPEIDEATAGLAAATLNRLAATRGPLIPTVSAQASFGGLGGGAGSAPLDRDFDASSDYALGLSWRIGPGGLLDRNRQREMQSRERQARLQREKVQNLIRRQVVEFHARVRSLATELQLARKTLDAADQTERLSRQRRETGVSLAWEDLQAEEDLARARQDYLTTIADYNLAQYALRYATGQ